MCLILLAHKVHPRYRLVLLANRDEFFNRATAPLDFWSERPDVLAGTDLEQGGTWMGVTRGGRLAAITNYRDPNTLKNNAPSRGHLVADFLLGSESPTDYLSHVRARAHEYNGFNLVVGDQRGLYCFSNRAMVVQTLGTGIFGLSNHLLDTPWPKVEQGKQAMAKLLRQPGPLSDESCFAVLQRQEIAPDDRLPRTGVDFAWERVLSPIFITSPTYGTRSSAALLIGNDSRLRFSERTWRPAEPLPRAAATRQFELEMKPVPGCG